MSCLLMWLQIYKEAPNMIREDQEIPILLMLRQVIEREVVLLPLANSSCNARGADENISIRNFFEGTKLLIAFLKQLSYSRLWTPSPHIFYNIDLFIVDYLY